MAGLARALLYISAARRFADLVAGHATLAYIDAWFQGEAFTRDMDAPLPDGRMRRGLVELYEAPIDWKDEAQNDRVLRVYARAIEEVGSGMQEAKALRKSLVLTWSDSSVASAARFELTGCRRVGGCRDWNRGARCFR